MTEAEARLLAEALEALKECVDVLEERGLVAINAATMQGVYDVIGKLEKSVYGE